MSVPSSVPFLEIVVGGDFWKKEAARFDNAEVTVLFGGDQASPKATGIRVRYADGVEMTQWADGRFEEGKYVSPSSR